METRFTVLGSGSGGNASFLEMDDFGLLIDAGLGPRQIASRLKETERSWDDVDACVLTHVHTDHWRDPSLQQLLQREILLYVHQEHVAPLRGMSQHFADLERAKRVRIFDAHAKNTFAGAAGLTFVPFRVSHDAGATFGFRIERAASLFHSAWSMAYAADLGVWRENQLPHFCDVDLLALEFNHDVPMQKASGRPQLLIDRVLGDQGHLSNEQAAELLARILSESPRGRLKNVVQLHLSRDCNSSFLAQRAAQRVMTALDCRARLQTAEQDRPVSVRLVRTEAVEPAKAAASAGK